MERATHDVASSKNLPMKALYGCGAGYANSRLEKSSTVTRPTFFLA